MSDQQDTLRSRTQYHENQRKQIEEHGADELGREPPGRNAAAGPTAQQKNRKRMGVNDKHKTEKMEKERRGTFP
ncbi:MAG TPA: hypothetical protein VIL43_09305 [Burkholderiales bacterium]